MPLYQSCIANSSIHPVDAWALNHQSWKLFPAATNTVVTNPRKPESLLRDYRESNCPQRHEINIAAMVTGGVKVAGKISLHSSCHFQHPSEHTLSQMLQSKSELLVKRTTSQGTKNSRKSLRLSQPKHPLSECKATSKPPMAKPRKSLEVWINYECDYRDR